MNPFEGYRITSAYGNRPDPFGSGKTEFHKGIDLVKTHRAPIFAFVSGEVIHAKLGVTGSGFGGYGITVAVRDKYGCLHVYAHLDSASVAVGAKVSAGQEVGKQGTTGQSTGSHLHYEVRTKYTPSYGYGTHTDPTTYLNDYFAKETVKLPKVEQWKLDIHDLALKNGVITSDWTDKLDESAPVWMVLRVANALKEAK